MYASLHWEIFRSNFVDVTTTVLLCFGQRSPKMHKFWLPGRAERSRKVFAWDLLNEQFGVNGDQEARKKARRCCRLYNPSLRWKRGESEMYM